MKKFVLQLGTQPYNFLAGLFTLLHLDWYGCALKFIHMYIPKSFYTTIALETLIDHFSSGRGIDISTEDLPDEFSRPAPCFVSLHTKNGKLRGCMGSVVPQKENLYNEIISNTIHAAFNDKRVAPLKQAELDQVSILVEVVQPMQRIASLKELQPDVYGVMVKDRTGKTGVLLPCPGEIETVEQQLKTACDKGGIVYTGTKELDIYRFKVVGFS